MILTGGIDFGDPPTSLDIKLDVVGITGWIAMKFSKHIHVPLRRSCHNSGDLFQLFVRHRANVLLMFPV